MGRPEKPLDPAAGAVQRLADELRKLRRDGGSPSYRTMAGSAGFSASALSQAAGGERLPSFAVFQAYVRACGGDPSAWEQQWKTAEAAAAELPVLVGEDDPAPYRGLARFEPDDHDLFFGRDRMLEQLQELVCEHRFAAVFGQSGSGKSSLLRAGLIPSLRREIAARGNPTSLRLLTPGDRPATTYGHLLAPAEDGREIWVVVDQFEEIFSLCQETAERARFIDLLLASLDPDSSLRVLIAIRADFYARCSEHLGLAGALHGAGLLVGPMTREELRDAVVKPAMAEGVLVERSLTNLIVEDVLDRPGALPLLSHAMLETWRRRQGRMLTRVAYEAIGGLRASIAANAEGVYGQLDPSQQRAAQSTLLRMIQPGRGTADTPRPLVRAELDAWDDPDVRTVVEQMIHARLLTAGEDGVRIAHEALISYWPRFHGWIEENRERMVRLRQLAEAAHGWLEHDNDPDALFRGRRLAQLEELFPDYRNDPALTALERAFLTAAFEARERERQAARRTRHTTRLLLIALSGALAVALVVGLLAWSQCRYKERE
ncbi:hypothetical protein ABZ490_36325 [Streptomyces sp. NPDC005811]|uniref:nSTAND1 domain-containing NTPase n=1 Tax=Streptomyces sp. NPDC005811 TaxID=3154565 RepID=UPI0033D77AFA